MKKKLEQFIAGNLPEEDEREVERWLLLNLPCKEANSIFEEMLLKAPACDDDGRKEATRKYINEIIDWDRAQSRKITPRKALLWALQAVAVLAIFIASFALHRYDETAPEWRAEYAAHGQVKRVILPDSSIVWLHNASKIVYPAEFRGRERRIYASGELYAEVSHDSKHPFKVECNGMTVKVLGTTFNLSTYEDSNDIELTLLEGKVNMDVPFRNDMMHFDLKPGDVVNVNRGTGESHCTRIDPSSYRSWKDRRQLCFIDEPLKNIIVELQRNFGVSIIVRDSNLMNVRYLASFINDEPLDVILSSLNADGMMSITQKDGVYYIHPRQ